MKKNIIFICLVFLLTILSSCVNFLGLKDASQALKVENPSITADSEEAGSSITVEISCETDGAQIRYTKDGSIPTKNSGIIYTSSFTINTSGINQIKALAYKSDCIDSDVVGKSFTINGALQSPALADNSVFSTPQSIIIPVLNGTEVYYTTDTTTPSKVNGTKVTTDKILFISISTTVKAIAFKDKWNPSPVVTRTYTVTGSCPSPILSDGGVFTSPCDVEIQVPEGFNVKYTTDKTTPTPTHGTDLAVDTILTIPLNTVRVIKAITYKTNWISSEIITRNYTITGKLDNPILPAEGVFQDIPHTISIPVVTGTKVRYTLDGTTPTKNYGIEITTTTDVELYSSSTIMVIAYKPFWEDSDIAKANYTITGLVAKPVMNISGGSYLEPQKVTLTCSTPDATIFYTTDNAEPSPSNGLRYNGLILVSENLTLRAKAFKTNWTPSETTGPEVFNIIGTYQFVEPSWTSQPKNGRLFRPTSSCVDRFGNVYVAEYGNNSVQKFDRDGNFQLRINFSLANPYDEYYRVSNVAVDMSGDIFVLSSHLNSGGHFIERFNSEGYPKGGKWGISYPGMTGNVCANDIEFDESNDLYVLDGDNNSGNKCIIKYDNNLNFLKKYDLSSDINSKGFCLDSSNDWVFVTDNSNDTVKKYDLKTGELLKTLNCDYKPWDVALNRDGNLFVSSNWDNENYSIFKYNSEGIFQNKFVPWGRFISQANLTHWICINKKDNILYVSDMHNYRILKYSTSNNAYIDPPIGYPADLKEFNFPTGIAIGKQTDYIYVADKDNGRIQVFNPLGDFKLSFGSLGSANGQFSRACDVAVDNEGSVYVYDSDNCRVQKFNASGSFILKFGTEGFENGQFAHFSGEAVGNGAICSDLSNDVYVTDVGNKRIQKFDSKGNFLSKITSYDNGISFGSPEGLAVDNNNNLYVSDLIDNVIIAFDSEGNYKYTMAFPTEITINCPTKMFIDTANFMYLADSGNKCIRKFKINNASLELIATIGHPELPAGNTMPDQFNWPCGVSVDSWGTLYIVDLSNWRVALFRKK